MSNGEWVSIDLSNVSLTLLKRVKRLGRRHTPSLSEFAREALKADSMGYTEYFSRHYPFQNQPEGLVERKEQKYAEVFLTYSTDELVEMDVQGITILNTWALLDLTDRSWAD